MDRLSFILAFIILCTSCNNVGSKTNKEILDEVCTNEDSDTIITIPVFSKCSNHNNNLSEVASEITFIPLEANPPINDFHISSIELADKDIFLSTISEIMHFDHNGKYIKNIGKKGMGPKEFINISYPLQLDLTKTLIYATDLNRQRVVVYRFDGAFENAFPLKGGSCIALIDGSTIALRQTISERLHPNCPLIRFIDYNGKELKTYPSRYYPISRDKMELYGPDMSPLWKNKQNHYYLEYGTDTIFSILGDSLVPSRVLTGDLKLSLEEHYKKKAGNKLQISAYIQRPNSGIFESDHFIIFRLSNDYEHFFMIYDKKKELLHRTFYKSAIETRAGQKEMAFFIDDMVSGLPYNPQYQSDGKAIALIPASDIYEKKQEILDFIDRHPNGQQSEQLKSIIQNLTEDDNPILMIATFK